MKSGCGATSVRATRSPARSSNASSVSSPATPPPTMTTWVPFPRGSLLIARTNPGFPPFAKAIAIESPNGRGARDRGLPRSGLRGDQWAPRRLERNRDTGGYPCRPALAGNRPGRVLQSPGPVLLGAAVADTIGGNRHGLAVGGDRSDRLGPCGGHRLEPHDLAPRIALELRPCPGRRSRRGGRRRRRRSCRQLGRDGRAAPGRCLWDA